MQRRAGRLVSTLRAVAALLYGLPLALPMGQANSNENSATAIIEEALRSNVSDAGRPLPLLSHWNTGKLRGDGWSPRSQISLIEQGHHILPWFELPVDPGDSILSSDQAFSNYYREPMLAAKRLGLPFTLIGSQWESPLSVGFFLHLPPGSNPNVITESGQVLPVLSPFGPVDLWRKVGNLVTSTHWMSSLQSWYPDPPLIIFLSNNEQPKLAWGDAEKSRYYIENYGRQQGGEFKRGLFAKGWVERYRALTRGMREGLSSDKWARVSRFVGFNAFGLPFFGRWYGWVEHSLYTQGNINPWASSWDGASVSYYLDGWRPISDYTVWSTQVETMNLIFQKVETESQSPEFWFELSVWDGYSPGEGNLDKRIWFEKSGQSYSPARYVGMVQFGMWLIRPRVVREFRGWEQPFADCEPYFMALLNTVDRVYENPVLREWWRHGQLVPNRSTEHPYQVAIPAEYAGRDRWYLLETDVGVSGLASGPRPWSLETKIPVFALALTRGQAPNRQWLLYAHAPMGTRTGVGIGIPQYRTVTVDVALDGSFYEVEERGAVVRKVL